MDASGFLGTESCAVWGALLRERTQMYQSILRCESEYLFRVRKELTTN